MSLGLTVAGAEDYKFRKKKSGGKVSIPDLPSLRLVTFIFPPESWVLGNISEVYTSETHISHYNTCRGLT